MKLHRNIYWRWCAAVTLLTWMAAQTLCVEHCSQDICNGDFNEASPHDLATVESHHHDGDSHDAENSSAPSHHHSEEGSFCLSLKTVLLSGNVDAVVSPNAPLLYLIPSLMTSDARGICRTTSVIRQFKRPIWVSAPQVCLGPAFRSLAPPVLS